MGYIKFKDIKKIGHNLEEIRERALLRVYSKIKLGYIFEKEFRCIKELLFNLFKWFEYDDPKHQGVAIKMIFGVLNSPLGYIVMDIIGEPKLKNDLVYLKTKVQSDLIEKIDIIIKLVQTKIDKSEMSLKRWSDYIESDDEISETSDGSIQSNEELNEIDAKLLGPGIQIYLMPWVQLCKSDLRKITLNEECIIANNSIERAIFFFNHVLLIDFPADVFLNRPTTIKAFQAMISNSKHSILSMEAILLFCDRINVRIQQIYDPSLMHSKISPFINFEDWKTYGDQKQYMNSTTSFCDPPTALNQLPLPIFCLDTMYIIVNLFSLNISQSTQEKTDLSLEQMNIAFSLLFKLLDVFQRTININIKTDQDQNTQEVVQKMVQLLRSCGDILNKFKSIYYMNEAKDPIYRICYLRMLIFCISFAKWCDYAPFLPPTFISNLFNSLDDISFSLIYPKYHVRLQTFLKNHGSLEERKKLIIYKNIKDISDSMDSAIILLQNFDSQSESIDIIDAIKKSIVALEFHKNVRFIANVVDVFCLRLSKWNLSSGQWQDIKNITLTLLAHSCVWIQESFYQNVRSGVVKVLGGLIKTSDDLKMYDESSLKFLIDPCVLMEICSFGVASKSKHVRDCSKDIIQHLIKGKLLMSEAMWRTFLEAILPALPILHTYAAHEDDFGKSIIKMLDLKIGECMLIPKIELLKGNVRLLYSKCFTAQMEGSKNLVKFLYLDEENDKMLPKSDCIRSDILCSAIKLVGIKNFNVNKPKDPNFYEQGGFLQVINLLKNNINCMEKLNLEKDDEFSRIDPSFGRSALAQLAVMLQQTNLHELFYAENGCDIIKHYLRASLTSSEFTTFPESAMSCISILNSLCYNSTTIRQWASEDHDILLNIIRAILLFPSEENFIGMASQLLSLLSFSHHIVNSENPFSTDDYWTDNLSLNSMIVSKMNLPFKCTSHSQISQYQSESNEILMMKQSTLSEYLRIYWSIGWFGGLDKVLRWPYLPEKNMNDDFNQSLMITNADLMMLKASSPIQGCVSALYQIQNATTHKAVNNGINTLIGYILLSRDGESDMLNFDALPWKNTLQRFLSAPPASPKDLLLLLNFLDFVPLYLELFEKNNEKVSEALWAVESTLEAPFGICALLEKDDVNDWVDNCELFSFKLKQKIIEFICKCCKFCNEHNLDNIVWNNTIHHLSNCLTNLQINNMNSLAYAGQILECLTHLLNSQSHGLNTETDYKQLKKLVYTLIHLCESLYVKDDLSSHKGFSLVFNSLMIFSRLLDILPGGKEHNIEYWVNNPNDDVLFVCLMWEKSNHLLLRTLSLKVLGGMVAAGLGAPIYKRFEDDDDNILEVAVKILLDPEETSLLREQTAILLCNLISKNSGLDVKQDFLSHLTDDFFIAIADNIVSVHLDNNNKLNSGIVSDYLAKNETCNVAFAKNMINNIPLKQSIISAPNCTVGLLISISNLLYNSLILYNEVSTGMYESSIFKILYGCISLEIYPPVTKYSMCASICRTLYKATELSRKILKVLLNQKNYIEDLIELFTNTYLYKNIQSPEIVAVYIDMWRWGFLLLGSFMSTYEGYTTVWNTISDFGVIDFFNSPITTLSDSRFKDVIPSSLNFLVNLFNSYYLYSPDKCVRLEHILDFTGVSKKTLNNYNELFNDIDDIDIDDPDIDELNTNFIHMDINEIKSNSDFLEKSKNAVLGEEFCFHLLQLYNKYNTSNIENKIYGMNLESVTSGLITIFGISSKARILAVNLKFTQHLVDNLNEIYNILIISVKPHNMRSGRKIHIMNYLSWTIGMLCNLLNNCDAAKEACVESNLVSPINKLWPWILSDNTLLNYVVEMLLTFTNSCPKACNSMCATIGKNSLVTEIVNIVLREMNFVSRSHSPVMLEDCLKILCTISCHIHCRTIIMKSEIFACLNKIHPTITRGQQHFHKVVMIWDNFCDNMSKYPECQVKIAEYLGVLCAICYQTSNRPMLTTLRNCSLNSMNRARYLASAELLHLFSKILTTQNIIHEKVYVCTAIWALCANNHKAKLSMKTLGITSTLADCVHRLECETNSENEFEVQYMSYVLDIIRVD